MTNSSSKESAPYGAESPKGFGNAPEPAKPRSRSLCSGLRLRVVIFLGVGAGLIAFVAANSAKLGDFDKAREEVVTAQVYAEELLNQAGSLEPEIAADLQGRLAHMEELLGQGDPSLLSLGVDLGPLASPTV